MASNPSRFSIMAKPPLDQRATIHRFPWAACAASLHHWTVQPLGKLFEIGCGVLTLREALDEVEAEPLRLMFDRVEGIEGGHATLISKNFPAAVRTLRLAICDALSQAGIDIAPRKSRPHVTLDYDYKGTGFRQKVDPILWEVDCFILVESRGGEHVHHGEWRLVPRQGTLFPFRSPLR